MSNTQQIKQSASELEVQHAVLQGQIEMLRQMHLDEPRRDHMKAEIRLQLGQVETCLNALREALGYTVADDLEASRKVC